MTPAEREAAILSLGPLVKIIAKKAASTAPVQCRLEDFISAGWLGAIKAVDRFDPAHDVELRAFAQWKIRGAIIDYQRSVDHLKRDHRRQLARDEADAPVTLSIDQPVDLHTHRSDHVVNSSHEFILDIRPERDRARLEARLTLEAIYRRARISERYRTVLTRFMEGEQAKEISRSTGITANCVSQICFRAIRQLRRAA